MARVVNGLGFGAGTTRKQESAIGISGRRGVIVNAEERGKEQKREGEGPL